jgi:acetyl esterase/lipase
MTSLLRLAPARFRHRVVLAGLLCAGATALPGQPAGRTEAGGAVPAGIAAHRNLAYVEGGHHRQVLDLYVPEKAAAPRPLVVWIHGGGWSGGDKAGCPPLRQGYAEQGYAIASLNYRLSQDAVFPAQIEDCKAAIRWLRAHARDYGLDPDRIGVWGSSAGGHLVALLGTSGDVAEFDVGAHRGISSRVQCVLDDYGPTDFAQMDAHRLPAATLAHGVPGSPESRLLGVDVGDAGNAREVTRANPITYVTGDDPPFLIVHGDLDPLVPHHQSKLLFDALRAAGVRVRLNTVKGGGHGAGFGGAVLERIRRDFLAHHLQGAANAAAQWPAAMRSSTDAVAAAAPKSGRGPGK